MQIDLANERVVLATMLHDSLPRRKLARELQAASFADPRHQVMFRALASIAKANLDYSEDTLQSLAGGEDFGGFAYVRALLEDYEPAKNLAHHVDRLLIDSAKHALLAVDLPAIAEACKDPRSTPEKISRMTRSMTERMDRLEHSEVPRGQEAEDGYFGELRMRKAVGGIVDPTGFPLLDRCLSGGGFSPGMSVVVGRPMHGKSSWLANFLRNRVALRKPTYVCGWEMSLADYFDMMVSQETGIPAADLKQRVHLFSAKERDAVTLAVERLTAEGLIAIEASPFEKLEAPASRWDYNARNLAHLMRVLERECDRYSLFAVDVVGKMLHDKRPDEISTVLARLRTKALDLGVHVMLLHHLNRDAAQSRPTLEGIKGSGAFEEEADVILGIDRPILRASAARRRKMTDVLDVHGLKQRKGPAPFCVRYKFDGAHFALTDEVEVDVSMMELEEDSSNPN